MPTHGNIVTLGHTQWHTVMRSVAQCCAVLHHHHSQCRARWSEGCVVQMLLGCWDNQEASNQMRTRLSRYTPMAPTLPDIHPVRMSLGIKHAYWMAFVPFHASQHHRWSDCCHFWVLNVSSHISQERSHISESFQCGMEVKHLLGVMAKFQVSTISRRVDRDFWMRGMSMLNLGPKRTLNPQPQFSNSPTPTLNSNVAWVLDRLSCLSMS